MSVFLSLSVFENNSFSDCNRCRLGHLAVDMQKQYTHTGGREGDYDMVKEAISQGFEDYREGTEHFLYTAMRAYRFLRNQGLSIVASDDGGSLDFNYSYKGK
tara:strand:+ start:192 stop:497 length:306 start_codon:yes stop_codon:yes gene_type:complete